MNESTFQYIGTELSLFSKAINWKTYFSGFLRPLLVGRVLEVGAGIGSTTKALCDGTQQDWTCLEPDAELALTLHCKILSGELPKCCRVQNSQAKDLSTDAQYDTILYIDVLEHVQDDSEELSIIANHLAPGGFLAILAPAHQFLFSEFDQAIGHCRRYNLKSMERAVPCSLTGIRLCYLDSFGLIASIANKTLSRQSMPTVRQIEFWDRHLIPLSRIFDWFIHYRIGKSVIGIWKK